MKDITIQKSPNFGYPRGKTGRNGEKIEAIVNHVSGGEWQSNADWLMREAASASYHYYVRRDGRIVQFVDEENAAWANGRINKATWRNIKSGVNPNLYTVSICREGHNHWIPTEAQYKSILEVHQMLIPKYDIPVDRLSIIGHNEIDSVNRWYCPGRGFPWDRLMGDLKIIPSESKYIVQRGDNLTRIGYRYGLSLSELLALNPAIKNPNLIRPGQEILVDGEPKQEEAKVYSGNSVVDYLSSIGTDSSFQNRARLFRQQGGSGVYRGTAQQNNWLLGKLRGF